MSESDVITKIEGCTAFTIVPGTASASRVCSQTVNGVTTTYVEEVTTREMPDLINIIGPTYTVEPSKVAFTHDDKTYYYTLNGMCSVIVGQYDFCTSNDSSSSSGSSSSGSSGSSSGSSSLMDSDCFCVKLDGTGNTQTTGHFWYYDIAECPEWVPPETFNDENGNPHTIPGYWADCASGSSGEGTSSGESSSGCPEGTSPVFIAGEEQCVGSSGTSSGESSSGTPSSSGAESSSGEVCYCENPGEPPTPVDNNGDGIADWAEGGAWNPPTEVPCPGGGVCASGSSSGEESSSGVVKPPLPQH